MRTVFLLLLLEVTLQSGFHHEVFAGEVLGGDDGAVELSPTPSQLGSSQTDLGYLT